MIKRKITITFLKKSWKFTDNKKECREPWSSTAWRDMTVKKIFITHPWNRVERLLQNLPLEVWGLKWKKKDNKIRKAFRFLQLGWEILLQLAYLPNLAPSDCSIFLHQCKFLYLFMNVNMFWIFNFSRKILWGRIQYSFYEDRNWKYLEN